MKDEKRENKNKEQREKKNVKEVRLGMERKK